MRVELVRHSLILGSERKSWCMLQVIHEVGSIPTGATGSVLSRVQLESDVERT